MNKKCDNIFCIHNSTNIRDKKNNTDCFFHESIPYKNSKKIKVKECPAYKKYKRMGW